MRKPVIYPGVIDKVWAYDGATQLPSVPLFGPASTYVYDVWVNTPEGAILIERMIPAEERYPDTVNVVPLQTNRVVAVGSIGGQLQLMASEKLHIVPCGAPP